MVQNMVLRRYYSADPTTRLYAIDLSGKAQVFAALNIFLAKFH